jgi:transcriptional regulator with PAS, ATPase and Fis domain
MVDVSLTLEDVERLHVERVLRHHEGHVERAAQALGISRASLYEKIRRYNLTTPRGKTSRI